jgi:hypothetical protein
VDQIISQRAERRELVATTGLEPAASCLTGKSAPNPAAPVDIFARALLILVDEMGFEPTTSSLRTVGKIS